MSLKVLCVAGLVLLAGCSGGEAGVDPQDKAQVARGEPLYREHCASCHGANGEGQPDWRRRRDDGRLPAPPHDETGHTWHHPNSLLIDITRHGMIPPWAPDNYASDMPAFEGRLSDEDIRAVIAYIQSKWPPEVWEVRARMAKQGR